MQNGVRFLKYVSDDFFSIPSGNRASASDAPLTPLTIRLFGDYDLVRTEELTKALEPVREVGLAIIDFSAVTFLDSTALRCLLAARKQMLMQGSAIMRFCNVSPNIKRTLRVTGLERIFEIV